jgi:2-amino-4-hydroxy-6-hydroxymethyldihydropteridine diphosphokinase
VAAGYFTPAYVGLGSNLGHPVAQLRGALAALGGLPGTRLVARSALYRNPPMGPPDQPEYVNAVAALLTTLTAGELLRALQQIESDFGRKRGEQRWGPRTLDLDLLLYGDLQLASDELILPHPGLATRPFVLIPLSEIAPALRLPGGKLIASLVTAVGDSGLERLEAG